MHSVYLVFLSLLWIWLCFATDRQFSKNQKLQVTLVDEVLDRQISLNAWILEPLGPRSLPGFRSWRYRCEFCPSIALTTSYRALYDRLLADSHVKKLIREQPLSVNHSNDESVPGDFMVFKVAERLEEKEMAYRLVHEEYTKRGFIVPRNQTLFTSLYQLLPNTTTYIGVIGGEVVMTLASVVDTPMKLPMDSLFSDYLEKLRDGKRHLVEFTMLAMKSGLFRKGSYEYRYQNRMSGLFSLFRLALRHTMRTHAVSDLVVAVPPHYEKMYQYLCFEPVGEVRCHPQWNYSPMMPLYVNLNKVASHKKAEAIKRQCLWEYFFKKMLPKQAYTTNGYWTRDEIRTLFQERSDLLQRIAPQEAESLYRHFPTLKEKITSLI